MGLSERDLLHKGLGGLGIQPLEQQVEAILAHLRMVREWNERINLTAITDPQEMVLKHAIDSASVLSAFRLEPGHRVLDVGTGAGFPGVTLKCLEPQANLVLLESLAKRCRFLDEVQREILRELGPDIGGFEILWGRAEEAGQKAGYREAFDLVTARAVADLRVLSELCLPFCRVGGTFISMKGPEVSEELSGAANAIKVLGGEVETVKAMTLPEMAGRRTLVRIRKTGRTPSRYPRKAGMPAKFPL